MPGSTSSRPLKRVRCNMFNDRTGDPLTSTHGDKEHADICRFAHPCELDWDWSQTAITKFYPTTPYPRRPSFNRSASTQDSGWASARKSSIPHPVPERELATSDASAHPINHTDVTSVQDTPTSSGADAQNAVVKPSSSSKPQPESPIRPRQNSLIKFFELDPSRVKELSKGDSKSKWKPIGPGSDSRKSTTGTSDEDNVPQNVSSTPVKTAGSDCGDNARNIQADKTSYVAGMETAGERRRALTQCVDVLQQLFNLIDARRDTATQPCNIGELIQSLSGGATEADPDIARFHDHEPRDCTTKIDELLDKLSDPARMTASEEAESLAESLKELLAPASSQRVANMQDAELFIQAFNEKVLSGVSDPLSSLQSKLETSLRILTERQETTGAQQLERLEDWSETVRKEMDATELTHSEQKSSFEEALLGMRSAVTQASADRGGKLARIAELDNEFSSLRSNKAVLVGRLNTIEAADAEIREGIRTFWPSPGVNEAHASMVNPLRNEEIAGLHDRLIQLDIRKAHIEGWNELLHLQRKHESAQMDAMLKDIRSSMERSNIVSVLVSKWIRNHFAATRTQAVQNAAAH